MAARYHQLSIAEKRTVSLARIREPAVTCPSCDTQVMPADLVAHLEHRCPGPREPGPSAQWLTWGEAIEALKAANLSAMALSRWVQRGEVRYRGGRGDRQYLMRDVVLRVAAQMGRCRR